MVVAVEYDVGGGCVWAGHVTRCQLAVHLFTCCSLRFSTAGFFPQRPTRPDTRADPQTDVIKDFASQKEKDDAQFATTWTLPDSLLCVCMRVSSILQLNVCLFDLSVTNIV